MSRRSWKWRMRGGYDPNALYTCRSFLKNKYNTLIGRTVSVEFYTWKSEGWLMANVWKISTETSERRRKSGPADLTEFLMKQSNQTSHANLKAWRTWCCISQKSFVLNWLYGLFYRFIFNFVDIRSFFFQEHARIGSETTLKSVKQTVCVNIAFCRICCFDKF